MISVLVRLKAFINEIFLAMDKILRVYYDLPLRALQLELVYSVMAVDLLL